MTKEKKERPVKIKIGCISAVVIAVIVLIAVRFVYSNFFDKRLAPKTVVSSILRDEKIVTQLSTLVVPYGCLYDGKDEKGKALQIAYRGTATYGIDFSKIEILEEEQGEEKAIIIRIPKVELQEVLIDPKSMSSIPEGKIDDLQNRIKICKEDLISRFDNNDDGMYDLAAESAKETINSFIAPIINDLDSNWKVIVETIGAWDV